MDVFQVTALVQIGISLALSLILPDRLSYFSDGSCPFVSLIVFLLLSWIMVNVCGVETLAPCSNGVENMAVLGERMIRYPAWKFLEFL